MEELGEGQVGVVVGLYAGLPMGDDGRAIHFTAGSRDGQHHAQRNGCFGSLIVQVKCLPEITVGAGAHGDGLATVNGAAAANGQDKVHVVLLHSSMPS